MVHSCDVCLGQYLPSNLNVIDSDKVCYNCLSDIFNRAVESEDNYPPKWGPKQLKAEQFKKVLPRELRERFREKEREYLTAPAERVYCSFMNPDQMIDIGEEGEACGGFVGRIDEKWEENVKAGIEPHGRCNACGTHYCMNCGEQSQPQHTCKNPGPTKDDSAFEGLERGKDYQICPSSTCHRRIELRDGCNHMSCRCGKHFCFICGAGDIDERHWLISKEDGGCPRYGHPSHANAFFEANERVGDRAGARADVFQRAEWFLTDGQRRNAVVDFPIWDHNLQAGTEEETRQLRLALERMERNERENRRRRAEHQRPVRADLDRQLPEVQAQRNARRRVPVDLPEVAGHPFDFQQIPVGVPEWPTANPPRMPRRMSGVNEREGEGEGEAERPGNRMRFFGEHGLPMPRWAEGPGAGMFRNVGEQLERHYLYEYNNAAAGAERPRDVSGDESQERAIRQQTQGGPFTPFLAERYFAGGARQSGAAEEWIGTARPSRTPYNPSNQLRRDAPGEDAGESDPAERHLDIARAQTEHRTRMRAVMEDSGFTRMTRFDEFLRRVDNTGREVAERVNQAQGTRNLPQGEATRTQERRPSGRQDEQQETVFAGRDNAQTRPGRSAGAGAPFW